MEMPGIHRGTNRTQVPDLEALAEASNQKELEFAAIEPP